MRVVVRGAGVAGLAVAYELRRAGADVVVVERESAVGRGASFLAGGMLAPFCESEPGDYDVARRAGGAIGWWREVVPELVAGRGTLVVAPPRDVAELERFAARVPGEWVDDIGELEPDLAGRFRRAYWVKNEAHLDPRAALLQLANRLRNRGVEFRLGGEEHTGPVDWEVRCVGIAEAATDGACTPTRKPRSLRGVRGEMVMLQSSEVSLRRPVRLLHPRTPVYLVPRREGRVMVGATMIESASNAAVSVRSAVELLQAAYTVHPAFAEAKIVELGAGVRPAYSDNVPRVVRDGRTLTINGLYRHGFLLAPALAEEATKMIQQVRGRSEEVG